MEKIKKKKEIPNVEIIDKQKVERLPKNGTLKKNPKDSPMKKKNAK